MKTSFPLLLIALSFLIGGVPARGAEQQAGSADNSNNNNSASGGDGSNSAEKGASVNSKRLDALQIEIADYSCSSPNMKETVNGKILCQQNKKGELNCDPETVLDSKTKKQALTPVLQLQQLNSIEANQDDLKPEVRQSMLQKPTRLQALNHKLKRLCARLLYLNAAHKSVLEKQNNGGSQQPDKLTALNKAEQNLADVLKRTQDQCTALNKRMYRDGRRGIVCEDGSIPNPNQ